MRSSHNRPEFGRCWAFADLGRSWPNLVELGPNSVKFSPHLVKCGRRWPSWGPKFGPNQFEFGRFRQELADAGPIPAGSPKRPQVAQVWPKFRQVWPEFDFDDCGARRPKSGDLVKAGPMLEKIGIHTQNSRKHRSGTMVDQRRVQISGQTPTCGRFAVSPTKQDTRMDETWNA